MTGLFPAAGSRKAWEVTILAIVTMQIAAEHSERKRFFTGEKVIQRFLFNWVGFARRQRNPKVLANFLRS